MAIDLTDEFLSDVKIPNYPCPPARCTVEEWVAEAATLPYMEGAFGEMLVDRATADLATPQSQRWVGKEAIESLVRACGSIAAAAERLGLTPFEVAGKFSRSPADAPMVLDAEKVLHSNPSLTYRACARLGAYGMDEQFFARVARKVGLTREAPRETDVPVGVRNGMRRLKAEGHSYAFVGEAYGYDKSVVWKIGKREGW